MPDRRPDPDELLVRVREQEARRTRGKLKVFFGAAAGVGKTYAMLEAARAQRAAGVDTVTGVVVRETVPDSVLDEADDVELVDLPAEDLRRRLKEGRVYVPEQAAEAAEHFFREGNLIALRELALRHTAERVDAKMQRYRREHAIDTVWPVTEHVMVCIGPSPAGARLVRAGHRLAAQLAAPWVVAYVETAAQRNLGAEDRARVAQTLRL